MAADAMVSAPTPPSTRLWLEEAHAQLADLLPVGGPTPLLTDDLVSSNGDPTDAFAHFGIRRAQLQSLLANLEGIRCTAQGAARGYYIDQPAAPWPGFEEVWISVGRGLELSGRLGYASTGGQTASGTQTTRGAESQILNADCIVILPGLFGDNGVQRSRDLAVFLRESGFHVLALEIRGHGQTERRFPNECHTFGVLETDELMLVSDWLMAQPHVRRTGLVGYCWSANIALLAAWYDSRSADDPAIAPSIAKYLQAKPLRGRFAAGIMAFSPIVRWEDLVDQLDRPWSSFSMPIYAAIQDTVRDRSARKHYGDDSGSLRRLIENEFASCHVDLPGGTTEGFTFLRFLPYRDRPVYAKLDQAVTPLLIVHAANDPLAPVQDVADLVTTTHNDAIACLVLPNGGHVGFAAYARQYYFSLVASFFDPASGAAAPWGTGRVAVSQTTDRAAGVTASVVFQNPPRPVGGRAAR